MQTPYPGEARQSAEQKGDVDHVDLDEHLRFAQSDEGRIGIALQHLGDAEEGQDLDELHRLDPLRP